MTLNLTRLISIAGFGQLAMLIVSLQAPSLLNWKTELAGLRQLHRQMHWVYASYVVMAIVTFAVLSIFYSNELASGSGLARGVCAYNAIFWGIRLVLQGIFDIRDYLKAWWMKAGYVGLTVVFAAFTGIYSWAALHRLF
jgi:hypothetical protein